MGKTVLFHREFLDFSGGHLKVHDYFDHVGRSESFEPQIYFTQNSVFNQKNPWLGEHDSGSSSLVSTYEHASADVLFLAGQDWLALPESARLDQIQPKVNLIQHVRHADPDDARFPYLRYPATRICVSQQVADAVKASGQANGPVVAIPNGLNFEGFPPVVPRGTRKNDVFIVGVKQVARAQKLCRKIRKAGYTADLLDRNVPREQFLSRLVDARIAVFLPDETEGFYLPPLEAMALQTLVICPDCEGNRVFCRVNENSLQPGSETRHLIAAFKQAVAMSDDAQAAMLTAAAQTAREHDIETERQAFLKVLGELA